MGMQCVDLIRVKNLLTQKLTTTSSLFDCLNVFFLHPVNAVIYLTICQNALEHFIYFYVLVAFLVAIAIVDDESFIAPEPTNKPYFYTEKCIRI